MKNVRRISVSLITLLISFVFVPVVFAHPLGNFTINQYAGLYVRQDSLTIDYVLDMAEIPAFQEIAAFDANGNGQVDAGEAAGYHAQKCTSLRPDLNVRLNQQAVTLTLASSSVDFPAGVGGLPTLRLSCEYRAPLALTTGNVSLSFHNNVFPDRLGWKEIVVQTDGVSVQGDFPLTSLSHRLTQYPQDLLSSPLDQREVAVELMPLGIPAQNNTSATSAQTNSTASDRNDAFTRLILLDQVTFPTLLLALLVSFVWGAMHAMTPGHGKAVVGAYLVGSRGTMKHALYLGLTTTIAHTLGVFAFGLITLFAAQYVVPETLFPWITFFSGLFVVGIGLNLFFQRFKASGLGAWFRRWSTNRQSFQPAFSPSMQRMHFERTDHVHEHNQVLSSAPGHSHDHDHPHAHEHQHELDHHHHVHAEHSHTPPEAITWRSILALGVSGGLLPCPSALVVLLGAIALNRIGFGLILVLAFSLGLAGALTVIGMSFIYAGTLFERFPSSRRVIGILPVFSAFFISLIGLGILYRAVMEILA